VSDSSLLRYELGPSYQIQVKASSTDGSQSITHFTIQLNNLNDAPIAVDDQFDFAENGNQAIEVLLNDFDLDPNDTVRIANAVIISGYGNINLTNGLLSYQPGSNYDYLSVGETATVVVEYQIEDNGGLSDIAQAILRVHGLRDALIVNSANVSVNEDESVLWPISISPVDINGEILTSVIVTGLPEGTTIRDALGEQRIVNTDLSVQLFGLELQSLSIRLPENISGIFSVTVSTQSNLGLVSEQSINRTLEFAGIADAPSIGAVDSRGQLGTVVPIFISASLTDNDGSEYLVLGLRGVPVGMIVGDHQNQFISDSPFAWYDISNMNLTELYLDTSGGLNGNFSLEFRANSIEAVNSDTAVSEIRLNLIIDQVLPVFDYIGETTPNSSPTVLVTNSKEQGEMTPQSGPETSSPIATVEQGASFDVIVAPAFGMQPADSVPAINELISLSDNGPLLIADRELSQLELSAFEENIHYSLKSVAVLNNLATIAVQAMNYRITVQIDSTHFFSDSSDETISGVNSAMLMMWNMVRFTITTLPTSRDQEISEECRPAQSTSKLKRK
jgi:hypothetical protein